MFNYRQIENWFNRFDISEAEADRIAWLVETEEQFIKIWENEDWWKD